jgi:hypothetical protein
VDDGGHEEGELEQTIICFHFLTCHLPAEKSYPMRRKTLFKNGTAKKQLKFFLGKSGTV